MRVDLIVVGAGLAGLTAASRAKQEGLSVAVFDKGRAPGGRMSARRAGPFDHGAQYFTARGPAFSAQVEAWHRAELVAPWPARIGVFDGRALRAKTDAQVRWVGTPTMRAPLAALAENLDIACATRVTGLERVGSHFVVSGSDGALAEAPRALVTAPAPQAAALVAPVVPDLARAASAVSMAPCWATMVAFPEDPDLDFDGLFVDEGPLSWIARDSSKPGRPSGSRWVLHARPEWSEAHLEDAPEAVADALLTALSRILGAPLPTPRHVSAHRWRFARGPETAPGVLTDPNAPGLALAGDWCAGGRVEGAFDSGIEALEVLT